MNHVENCALPTAGDVAQKLGALVHNASSNLRISDQQLKVLSGRKRMHEGFRKPVLDKLNKAHFPTTRVPGGILIHAPAHDTILLDEALEINREAQESGWRQIPGGHSGDVMPDK